MCVRLPLFRLFFQSIPRHKDQLSSEISICRRSVKTLTHWCDRRIDQSFTPSLINRFIHLIDPFFHRSKLPIVLPLIIILCRDCKSDSKEIERDIQLSDRLTHTDVQTQGQQQYIQTDILTETELVIWLHGIESANEKKTIEMAKKRQRGRELIKDKEQRTNKRILWTESKNIANEKRKEGNCQIERDTDNKRRRQRVKRKNAIFCLWWEMSSICPLRSNVHHPTDWTLAFRLSFRWTRVWDGVRSSLLATINSDQSEFFPCMVSCCCRDAWSVTDHWSDDVARFSDRIRPTRQ